jgi:ABC-type branched-subunit amino acid transport system substrate-binding protein
MGRRGQLAVLPAIVSLAFLLAGCAGLPGSAAPVVKIGVIAPFEGAGRALGYAVLPAIKAAVAEANADDRLAPYRASVVAFNDNLDPQTSAQQGRALALDPDAVVVVGPFSAGTEEAVRPVLASAGLAGLPVVSSDPLSDDYRDEIAAAEAATRSALSALAAEIAASGRPDRAGVRARLERTGAP